MDVRAIALAAFALLVIGAGIGRNSIEPVIVEEHPTETIVKEVEVPGPTETVYVDRYPEVCFDAFDFARATNRRTIGALGLITPMTDALALARQGVASGKSEYLTNADNQLRRIQSRMLDHLPIEDLGGDPLYEAMKQCKAAIE